MYSTSLGNSVMISTSCSRGRQKLRFQISLKVRTARDQGALRGAPEKRVPSRALQRCPHRRAGCGGSPGAPKETATALLRTSRSHPSPRGSVPACRLRTPGGRAAGRQRTGAQPRVQASYRPLPRRSPRGGAALRRPVASLGGAAPTGGAAAGCGAARRRARSRETARSPAPTPSADSPGASALVVPRVSGACREGKAGIVGAARRDRRLPAPGGGPAPTSPLDPPGSHRGGRRSQCPGQQQPQEGSEQPHRRPDPDSVPPSRPRRPPHASPLRRRRAMGARPAQPPLFHRRCPAPPPPASAPAPARSGRGEEQVPGPGGRGNDRVPGAAVPPPSSLLEPGSDPGLNPGSARHRRSPARGGRGCAGWRVPGRRKAARWPRSGSAQWAAGGLAVEVKPGGAPWPFLCYF